MYKVKLDANNEFDLKDTVAKINKYKPAPPHNKDFFNFRFYIKGNKVVSDARITCGDCGKVLSPFKSLFHWHF
jgi:hypothetical protein